MELIYWVELFDKWWMRALNSIGSVEAIAFFFRLITGFGGLLLLWLALAFLVFIAAKRRSDAGAIFAAMVALVVAQAAADILKVSVGRTRPFIEMPDIAGYGPFESSYSFPSTHASIAFAAAAVLSKGFSSLRVIWYGAAFAIALSRVILGLHYPTDVIFGSALGYGFGLLFAKIFKLSGPPR